MSMCKPLQGVGFKPRPSLPQVSIALVTTYWFSYWRLDFDLRFVKNMMHALRKPVWPEWVAQKLGLRRLERLATISAEPLLLALWWVFERICLQGAAISALWVFWVCMDSVIASHQKIYLIYYHLNIVWLNHPILDYTLAVRYIFS